MADLMRDNVLTLLVGTGAVVSLVVIVAVLLLNRRSKAENKLERRKTSHVTEVLQVSACAVLPAGAPAKIACAG